MKEQRVVVISTIRHVITQKSAVVVLVNCSTHVLSPKDPAPISRGFPTKFLCVSLSLILN